MTKSQVKPANILLTLKENKEDNVTTIKQLYNARYTYKQSLIGCRTKLQQLMMLLERNKYIHWSRCVEDSDVVSELFWTHPNAIKLLNAFNIVLLMESTYKTNRYRLPLLEIGCVTSTGLTFSVAFVFLSSEQQNNFIWCLQRLKELFITYDGLPKVIVTNRDLALMNSISIVFPESYHLLCCFHIQKNVRAKCKMLINFLDAWDVVLDAWEYVMDCGDISTFADYACNFTMFVMLGLCFLNVIDTWIIPYKERFVKVWTNKVMHLGQTTTNKYV